MSYLPGTILSYMHESAAIIGADDASCGWAHMNHVPHGLYNQCTMLTGGNVLVTMEDSVPMRYIISFADWLYFLATVGRHTPVLTASPPPPGVQSHIAAYVAAKKRICSSLTLPAYDHSADKDDLSVFGFGEGCENYSIGSTLWYGADHRIEECIVMSDFKALVTYVDGTKVREVMNLEDWLLLRWLKPQSDGYTFPLNIREGCWAGCSVVRLAERTRAEYKIKEDAGASASAGGGAAKSISPMDALPRDSFIFVDPFARSGLRGSP